MKRINEILTTGAIPTIQDRALIEETASRYPWFTPAKLMLMRLYKDINNKAGYEKVASSVGVRLIYYPAPDILLEKIDNKRLRRLARMNIIEDFLEVENVKIVAKEKSDDNEEPIHISGAEQTDDDIVTETLAEIYRSQELYELSLKIYRKLSLKFPEKSVYFAEIIKEIKISIQNIKN